MNILPHKSWHVRTKKNIARVRKDEAKAAEEKKEEQRRILLAEQEARTEILRVKARAKYDGRADKPEDGSSAAGPADGFKSAHVNFFEELESGPSKTSGTNAEHEKEAKEEREKYEKSVGYLTYLGQDTVESTGIKPWYDKRPARLDDCEVDESRGSKRKKIEEDPLRIFAAFSGIKKLEFKEREIEFQKQNDTSVIKNTIRTELGVKRLKKEVKEEKERRHKKKKKSKKAKKKKRRRRSTDSEDDSSDSHKAKPSVSIEKLRAERLAREQAEKARAAALMAKINGIPQPEDPKTKQDETVQIKQKYNSQFNPHLARQNFEESDPWNTQPWNRR